MGNETVPVVKAGLVPGVVAAAYLAAAAEAATAAAVSASVAVAFESLRLVGLGDGPGGRVAAT